MRASRSIVFLTLALLVGTAYAERPLVRSRPVASRGNDVRLTSHYRAHSSALGDQALMPSPQLLNRANYENLRNYGKAIMQKFPPDRYYYVGVGRTAGPVIAFLKNVSGDIAANFPSSQAGGAPAGLASFRDNYHAHVDAMIPEAVRRGDRKIVLIDQSGGSSLKGIKAVFDDYRASGKPMPEVEMLTLGMTAPGLHSIDLGQEFWRNRESVAEFIGETADKGHVMHTAAGTLSALKRNPAYVEHRRRLVDRMRRDADLDTFLKAQFPQLVRTAD